MDLWRTGPKDRLRSFSAKRPGPQSFKIPGPLTALLAAAAAGSSSSRFAGLCLRTMEGGSAHGETGAESKEGRGFDNGHIKAALLPEKGDDEPRLKLKNFPGMEWAE